MCPPRQLTGACLSLNAIDGLRGRRSGSAPATVAAPAAAITPAETAVAGLGVPIHFVQFGIELGTIGSVNLMCEGH